MSLPPDGYMPPSLDPSQYDPNDGEWEASIELRISKLNGKVTIALGLGAAGVAIALLGQFLSKKILDAVGAQGNALQTLYQVEEARGTFNTAMPMGQHSASTERPWRAEQTEVIDESKTVPYEIHIDTPRDGPVSEPSAEVAQALANDPIKPSDVVKDEGIS